MITIAKQQALLKTAGKLESLLGVAGKAKKVADPYIAIGGKPVGKAFKATKAAAEPAAAAAKPGFFKDLLEQSAGTKVLGGIAAGGLGWAAKKGGEKAFKYFTRPRGVKANFKAMFGEGTPGRRALTFGAGAAGIAGGIKGIDALSDAATGPIMRSSSYNKMLKENPTLKTLPKSDVRKRFNTLYRFNPAMAKDPLVAGSFVRKAMEFRDEGIPTMDVHDLVTARKAMADAKRGDSALTSAFGVSGRDLLGFTS